MSAPQCERCGDTSKALGVDCPACKAQPHVFDLTYREVAALLVILPRSEVVLDQAVVGRLLDMGLLTSEEDEVYITEAGRVVIDQLQRIW